MQKVHARISASTSPLDCLDYNYCIHQNKCSLSLPQTEGCDMLDSLWCHAQPTLSPGEKRSTK